MKMPLTHYNLSSKIYRSTVFAGFSQLQKEEEFVDLTLAADGCFCKVHRSVIALASPYLRDILRNLPGSAPVIYLNKIRKEILEYILEYIYQGDVNIPVQLLEEFIEVSKSLHIAGIADLEPPKVSPESLKSIPKHAKKRKLERVSNIEVTKPADSTNLIQQLCESANIYNDYCMEDQNKSSNDFELRSHNTKPYQQSNKLLNVENSNKDLITFHTIKEKHNPSILIENEQTLEIPTETTPETIVDRSYKAQSYKIIVQPTKEQSEATDNIPLIEIQPCPSQEDNNIISGLPNELAMLANTTPDHNNLESSLPVFNILTKDNIKDAETDFITQSSQDHQPLIRTVTIPDQNNRGNSKPVFNIIRNDTNKHAETEYDTPSFFQVSQSLIEIVTIPDQNKGEKSKPVLEIIENAIIKSAETDYVTQSPQVNQPLIEIGSIPDQDNEGKSKPVLKIAEADYDTPAFQVSQLPFQTNKNLDKNNVEKSVPVVNILRNNEGAITDAGESSFKATLNDMKNMAQYSITERGALQLILNRFIYCCHGTSSKKQRWRCIDYRRGSCPAIVDTGADGAIVCRNGIHGHEFHDKKIFKKHNSGLIFNTLEWAIIARDLKQKERTKVVSFVESDDGDVNK